MSGETVIPLLPCVALDETLGFYSALGFEVTHEQRWPYVYGAVRWGSAELHFHGDGPRAPAATCLVMVPAAAAPHQAFVAGLKAALGRVPTAGTPRITRLRPGQARFAVFDPAGNTIIFIARDEPEVTYPRIASGEAPPPESSRLAQALETAGWLRDLKGFDDVAAARVLDKALARDEPAPPVDLARALAARAELALALGEASRATALRARLATVALTEDERARFQDELRAPEDLERLLRASAS